jgi:hypothetical protein
MLRKRSLTPKSIENQIFLVRGQKVLLDSDLAALYGVEVRTLNQAVKRNHAFPWISSSGSPPKNTAL